MIAARVRLSLFAAGGLLAIAPAVFALWWLFARPRAAKIEAATSRTEAATANGTAGASKDALKITVDVNQRRVAIDATTQENDRAIHAAPDAAAPVGADVAGAGRAALCLRDAYRDHPSCTAVRGDGDGIGPARADGWSFTTARR